MEGLSLFYWRRSRFLEGEAACRMAACKLAATFRALRLNMQLVVHGKTGVLPGQERAREILVDRFVFNQIIQRGMAQLLYQQHCRDRWEDTKSARIGKCTVGYHCMDMRVEGHQVAEGSHERDESRPSPRRTYLADGVG